MTFVGNARRELSIVDSSSKRLGKDGKFRNLPNKRTISPLPSVPDAAGTTSLPNGPKNGLESDAHETALEVASSRQVAGGHWAKDCNLSALNCPATSRAMLRRRILIASVWLTGWPMVPTI